MQLLMPFLNDKDGLYCQGYECGVAWVRMEQGFVFDNYTIHTANTEQFKLMCDYFGYEYEFKVLDETWTVFFASKKKIESIEDRIQRAIDNEDYELAARLKNEITK